MDSFKRILNNFFISAKLIKYVSLFILVAQNALNVLFMRHVRSRPGTTMFLSSVSVFWGEVVKLSIGFFLVVGEQKGFGKAVKTLYNSIFVDYKEFAKTAVPALIYSVQNILLYHAISHLDAATFMVTYQLKILTTALFTVILLKRKLSLFQWISLLVLFGGVVVVQWDVKFSQSNKLAPSKLLDLNSTMTTSTAVMPTGNKQNSILGLGFVFLACVLSGFAGIYLEKMLKFSKVSLWTRNFQLALLSLPLLFGITMINDHQKVSKGGFMQGFDSMVWITVFINAAGGLIVAVVIKYADNILKGFATSVAIIVSTGASVVLFSFVPSYVFILGAILVITAVIVYSVFPYKPPKPSAQTDDVLLVIAPDSTDSARFRCRNSHGIEAFLKQNQLKPLSLNLMKLKDAHVSFSAFKSNEGDDLEFEKYDILCLERDVDLNWGYGFIMTEGGYKNEPIKRGNIPKCYLKPIPDIENIDQENEYAEVPPLPNETVVFRDNSALQSNGDERAKVVSLFNFEKRNDNELSIEAGDEIDVESILDETWYIGINKRTGERGAIPKSYVGDDFTFNSMVQEHQNKESPTPTPTQKSFFQNCLSCSGEYENIGGDKYESSDPAEYELAAVLYDYTAQYDDELTVKEGITLKIIEFCSDEWVRCQNPFTDEVGIIPVAFLQIFTQNYDNEREYEEGDGAEYNNKDQYDQPIYNSAIKENEWPVLNNYPNTYQTPQDVYKSPTNDYDLSSSIVERPNANVGWAQFPELNKLNNQKNMPERPPPPLKTSNSHAALHELVPKVSPKPNNSFSRNVTVISDAIEPSRAAPPRPANAPKLSAVPISSIASANTDIERVSNGHRPEDRQSILEELLSSEIEYNSFLVTWEIGVKGSSILKEDEKNSLLKGYETLKGLATLMIQELAQESAQSDENIQIGKIFFRYKDSFFNTYTDHCTSLGNISDVIDKKDNTDLRSRLTIVVDEMRLNNRNVFDVASSVTRPIQRTLKYVLYLDKLIRLTPKHHVDYNYLRRAKEFMELLTKKMDDSKHKSDITKKYATEQSTTISERISRLNMHSLAKKSSRLKYRVSTSFGWNAIKDEEFKRLVLQLEDVNLRLLKFIYQLQLYRRHIKNDARAYVAEYTKLGYRFAMMENLFELFAEFMNAIPVKAELYGRQLEKDVIKNCSVLVARDYGRLIRKRNDKLADYENAISGKKGIFEIQNAKAQYDALNNNLKSELPTTIESVYKTTSKYITMFFEMHKIFVCDIDTENCTMQTNLENWKKPPGIPLFSIYVEKNRRLSIFRKVEKMSMGYKIEKNLPPSKILSLPSSSDYSQNNPQMQNTQLRNNFVASTSDEDLNRLRIVLQKYSNPSQTFMIQARDVVLISEYGDKYCTVTNGISQFAVPTAILGSPTSDDTKHFHDLVIAYRSKQPLKRPPTHTTKAAIKEPIIPDLSEFVLPPNTSNSNTFKSSVTTAKPVTSTANLNKKVDKKQSSVIQTRPIAISRPTATSISQPSTIKLKHPPPTNQPNPQYLSSQKKNSEDLIDFEENLIDFFNPVKEVSNKAPLPIDFCFTNNNVLSPKSIPNSSSGSCIGPRCTTFPVHKENGTLSQPNYSNPTFFEDVRASIAHTKPTIDWDAKPTHVPMIPQRPDDIALTNDPVEINSRLIFPEEASGFVNYENVIEHLETTKKDFALRLRRHLQFFFMDPKKKYLARGQFPFKLALQVFKIVIITFQLFLFAELRISHVDFIEDTSTVMRHKFLQNWGDERDVVSYPPSMGKYSVFEIDGIIDHMAYVTKNYYNIQNQSFASFSYDTILKDDGLKERNTTFGSLFHDIPYMKLCLNKIANIAINNNNYEFDVSPRQECQYLNLSKEEVQKIMTNNDEMRLSLASRNITFTAQDSLSINEACLSFNLRSIHFLLGNKDQTPECYVIKISIKFDNSRHTGQVFIDLKSVISYENICNGRVLKAHAISWNTIILFVIDIIVLAFCIFSLILCIRAVIKAQLLKTTTLDFFEETFKKKLSVNDQMNFLNMWYLMIIANDVLIILGTVCKVTIEFKDFDNDLFTLTSVFLGSGALLVYVGLLRYLGFFNKYNVLVLTLKKSIPNILRFLVCALILYCGFLVAGWVIIGPYSLKFRTLTKASETLFSLLNGDDMFATFETINDSNYTIKIFGTIYIYVFVSLFIYVVLSLFIAIIMDAYEVIKVSFNLVRSRRVLDICQKFAQCEARARYQEQLCVNNEWRKPTFLEPHTPHIMTTTSKCYFSLKPEFDSIATLENQMYEDYTSCLKFELDPADHLPTNCQSLSSFNIDYTTKVDPPSSCFIGKARIEKECGSLKKCCPPVGKCNEERYKSRVKDELVNLHEQLKVQLRECEKHLDNTELSKTPKVHYSHNSDDHARHFPKGHLVVRVGNRVNNQSNREALENFENAPSSRKKNKVDFSGTSTTTDFDLIEPNKIIDDDSKKSKSNVIDEESNKSKPGTIDNESKKSKSEITNGELKKSKSNIIDDKSKNSKSDIIHDISNKKSKQTVHTNLPKTPPVNGAQDNLNSKNGTLNIDVVVNGDDERKRTHKLSNSKEISYEKHMETFNKLKKNVTSLENGSNNTFAETKQETKKSKFESLEKSSENKVSESRSVSKSSKSMTNSSRNSVQSSKEISSNQSRSEATKSKKEKKSKEQNMEASSETNSKKGAGIDIYKKEFQQHLAKLLNITHEEENKSVTNSSETIFDSKIASTKQSSNKFHSNIENESTSETLFGTLKAAGEEGKSKGCYHKYAGAVKTFDASSIPLNLKTSYDSWKKVLEDKLDNIKADPNLNKETIDNFVVKINQEANNLAEIIKFKQSPDYPEGDAEVAGTLCDPLEDTPLATTNEPSDEAEDIINHIDNPDYKKEIEMFKKLRAMSNQLKAPNSTKFMTSCDHYVRCRSHVNIILDQCASLISERPAIPSTESLLLDGTDMCEGKNFVYLNELYALYIERNLKLRHCLKKKEESSGSGDQCTAAAESLGVLTKSIASNKEEEKELGKCFSDANRLQNACHQMSNCCPEYVDCRKEIMDVRIERKLIFLTAKITENNQNCLEKFERKFEAFKSLRMI
uniref:SH3 domain-containing protein n=1 Tax=Rhabditophanes sp. KR3021 TaxID=114890 RepID=A0AC35TYH8_9BILA